MSLLRAICMWIFDGHRADIRERGNLEPAGSGGDLGERLQRRREDGAGPGGHKPGDTVGDGAGDGYLEDTVAEGVGKKRGTDEGRGNHEKKIKGKK